jgi:large subunit ribosomal protein L17
MAASLILHKRINTTVAKAKALRKYVEPIITRSKDDSTHSRRMVFSYLQDKVAVAELFREVAPKVADRPGGYTRIIRLENRPGDNAEMCMMELVDFNLIYGNDGAAAAAPAKKTTRRGGAAKKKAEKADSAEPKAEKKAPAKKAKASDEAPKKTTRRKKSDDSSEKGE